MAALPVQDGLKNLSRCVRLRLMGFILTTTDNTILAIDVNAIRSLQLATTPEKEFHHPPHVRPPFYTVLVNDKTWLRTGDHAEAQAEFDRIWALTPWAGNGADPARSPTTRR